MKTPLYGSTAPNPDIRANAVFDLPSAIASGAINEQQLISVLTDMCRCVLSKQAQLAVESAVAEPGNTAMMLSATPVAV